MSEIDIAKKVNAIVLSQMEHALSVGQFGEYYLPDMTVLDGPTEKNNTLNKILAHLAQNFPNYMFEQKESLGQRGILILWYPRGKRHEHYIYRYDY